MRIRHLFVSTVIACLAAFCLFVPNEAGAKMLPVGIDDKSPEVKVDADGNRSVTIELENKTDAPVTAALSPARVRNDCDFRYTTLLRAGKTGSIDVALGNCVKSTPIRVDVEGLPAASLSVVPDEPKVEPEWNRLLEGFGVGLVISLFLVGYGWNRWRRKASCKTGPRQRLEYIESTWSLKENWATDVSAVAAVFTGFFGTAELVKAYAGAQGEAMLAVSTIAAAIALALVGLTPIVLQGTKSYWDEDGSSKSSFTVGGVMLGVLLVLTSVFGQLWALYNVGVKFDLGVSDFVIAIPFALAGVMLMAYAVRSLTELLKQGSTEPPTPPPTPDPVAEVALRVSEAARVIARPLWVQATRNSEEELLRVREQEELLEEAAEAAAGLAKAERALEIAQARLVAADGAERDELRDAVAKAQSKVDRERDNAEEAARRSAEAGGAPPAGAVVVPVPMPADAYELTGPGVESSPPPYQSTSAMI